MIADMNKKHSKFSTNAHFMLIFFWIFIAESRYRALIGAQAKEEKKEIVGDETRRKFIAKVK